MWNCFSEISLFNRILFLIMVGVVAHSSNEAIAQNSKKDEPEKKEEFKLKGSWLLEDIETNGELMSKIDSDLVKEFSKILTSVPS